MRIKHYSIPINPIAWKRAGISKNRFYDTQAHEKNSCGLIVIQQHNNEPPFENKPLGIRVVFHIRAPKSKSKFNLTWHYTYPDEDNFKKFLYDMLTDSGVIQDDRLFAHSETYKVYSKDPRTEFSIWELSDEEYEALVQHNLTEDKKLFSKKIKTLMYRSGSWSKNH